MTVRRSYFPPLRVIFLWLAVILCGVLMAPSVRAGSLPENVKATYPATRVVELVESQFGDRVADPYRWLENDVRVDPEVAQWVDDENRTTQAYLAQLPARGVLAARMKQLFNYERFGVPRKAANRYFYTYNDGLKNQSVLMVRDGANGTPRLLLDPNSWAKDGATALGEWMPSDDGSRLLYTVQDGGTDWRIIHVLDVVSGKILADEIKWVKFSAQAWAADGAGFYYSRFAEPAKAAAFQSAGKNHSVYFHALGTAQASDLKIYATPVRPNLLHTAQVTDDGRYLLISSSDGGTNNELNVLPLDGKQVKPRMLVSGLDNVWELAGTVGSAFYFLTDKDAPRRRLVTLDVQKRKALLREIVPQGNDALVGASLVGERLILAYLGDAKSEAELRDLSGRLIGPIRFPDIGTASGFGGKGGDSETFFSFSSFAIAPTLYRFDTSTGRTTLFAQPKLGFDPADFVTEQRFYPSKDGTRVPMFVVRRKDRANKAVPTLLSGYGGFNIAQTPSFSPARLAWIEQGGILAIANLRGGGEYGKAWHDAGRLAQKQNVFDDFIAAGEYLVAQGLTTKAQLAIEGRSNGGLLVGAVVNQRPDLFAAALPAVGVMDMLRFNRFTAGKYWVDDYGDPGREADFKVLRAYSPYHNINSGKDYPAIMVTTADTDDRVVPGHSFKYAAALQAAEIGARPHLIRIEKRAGHGSGKPVDKIVAEFADAYAFVAKWTGLDVKPPSP